MDADEIIKSVSEKIVDSVPYPLGLSLWNEVLVLNEKAKNLIGDCFSLALPQSLDKIPKSLYIALKDHKTVEISIIHLGGPYFLLVFKEVVDESITIKDELTGLLSRQYLNLIGERILGQCSQDRKVAVFFMDLDGFKEVNDNFGHDIGDEVLKEVGRRLLNSTRKMDLCFRWGGDEFIVISQDFVEKIHTGLLARRIIRAISEPFIIGNHKLSVGVSIGIAVYPDDGSEISELLKKADTAMYEAKEQGGSLYHIFGMH